MKEDSLQDMDNYTIRVHYLKIYQSECFNWTSIFTVELPVHKGDHSDGIDIKKNDVVNLQGCANFGEVKYISQYHWK